MSNLTKNGQTDEPAYRVTKRDFCYHEILQRILDERLAGGQSVSERELGNALNMSRTPIKEALHRLAFEGFVERRPEGGVLVARMSMQRVLEVHELREVLDAKAAELFARRKRPETLEVLESAFRSYEEQIRKKDYVSAALTDGNQFHTAVARGCLNKTLESVLTTFIKRSLRGTLNSARLEARALESYQEHREILLAIQAGDPERSYAAAQSHMRAAGESLKQYFMENYYAME
jgi:DNA-binding GntR family transcriptional regulator